MAAREVTPPPDGKILIVGGGRGICRLLANELGDHAVVWTRSGGIDASQRACLHDAYASFVQAHGTPYGLVHCVGEFVEQPLLGTTSDTYGDIFRSNVESAFHTIQTVVPSMVAQARGRVILFAAAGVDRDRAMKRAPVYFAAKAALVQMARSLAAEVASAHVTVNVIAPGLIAHEHSHQASQQRLLQRVPVGRLGRPDDVTAIVRYLLSESADYVTGQVLTIDGGLHG